MTGRSFPLAVRVAVGIALTAAPWGCGGSAPPPPAPLRIRIDGAVTELAPGTTFAVAVAQRGLQAQDGRLLSVSGKVLDPRAERGVVLLNGSTAPGKQPLRQGDAIRVVDGDDHVESTRRIVAKLPQRSVTNPAHTLTEFRLRQITVEGRLSGELVSIREVPIGRGKTPKAVALTFDDGPWPGHTERILAILKRFKVTATFYMVGLQAERYSPLVRRVLLAGHQIGNHSFSHPVDPLLVDMTETQIVAEISDTNEILTGAGAGPTTFRPPGGSYDEFVVQEARRQGMRVVMWSVDPKDWRAGRTSRELVKKVLSQVRAGSIILLHDGGGDADHTIRALPELIRGIKKKGLGFVTIPP